MTSAPLSLDLVSVHAELRRGAAALASATGCDGRRAALSAMADALARACREAGAYETFPAGLVELRTTIDSHLLAVVSIEDSAGSRQTIERLIDRATLAVTRAVPALL
jgi:hypothetical protein